MIRRSGVLLFIPFVVLVLQGCALMGKSPGSGDKAWDSRRVALQDMSRWSLQARVATSRVGMSGNMRWHQEAEHFDISVAGPLGVGAFQARGSLEEVEIRTPRETIVTREPETFLRERVGSNLPLKGLRYWALGLPDPARPSEIKYDGTGRLTELRQDGWTMEYTDYGKYGKYELPHKFTLDNDEVKIRVVVDDWTDFG